MEHEAKDPAAVTRSQNAIYLLPHDAIAADAFLATAVQRIDTSELALQLLIVASDAETTASLAGTAVRLGGDDALRVVPVAALRRAERRVREGAHVVVGTAADLLGLVRTAALKPEQLRTIVVAWADAVTGPDVEALDALFAEVPKTTARVIVAAEETEAVGALVERHARRARRAATRPEGEATGIAIGYVTAAASGRAATLRRVIDGLDPASARVVVRSEESERTARQAIAAMGYHGSRAPVTIVREGESASDPVELAILFDLPTDADGAAAIATSAKRTVALVQPRQLASLRLLARGGAVTPVALPDVAARGEAEVAALRQALANELRSGAIGRELLVLEPLLEEHDAFELAAAALRLVGRATAGAASVGASASSPGAGGPMTRVFVNVGEMDNARPGDLVGAVINEGGLQRDQVGRVELRDKHAIIEVASGSAEQVIERLTGASIRGRRVQARLDQERPMRPERGDRAPRAGGREGGFTRDRAPRDRERPPRDRGFDRDRAPRGRDAGGRDARGSGRPPRPRRGES